MREALADIGPAVFNGGFSAFLAFILLANSKSHVFSTFFKVFFLVIVFGLFNGLLLLPVMLSLVGPAAYSQASKEETGRDIPQYRSYYTLGRGACWLRPAVPKV